MDQIQSRRLIAAGLVVMAVRALLQSLVDRGGHTTDLSDFLLGAMLGVGIALTLLGLWRHRRQSRCTLDS